jgi:hypothetical protein
LPVKVAGAVPTILGQAVDEDAAFDVLVVGQAGAGCQDRSTELVVDGQAGAL